MLQLFETSRRGLQRAPGLARLGPPSPLLGADERVEELQLVRLTGEPPLRELARQREQALGRRDDVLPRDASPPRVRAGATVGRDAAGDDEARLVLGAQLAKRLQAVLVEEPFRDVELCLDVRLAPVRSHGRRVGLRAEQQPDRLGHDRLPCARLAGQRDQPGREVELGLADQDEVLDAQSTQHGVIVDGRSVPGICPNGPCLAVFRSRSSAGTGSRTSPPGASRGACGPCRA